MPTRPPPGGLFIEGPRASRPSLALEHDLVRPFSRGLALRSVAYGPGHDRGVEELLHQERDLMGQVVDVKGQEIRPQAVEMVEIRPVAFLFRVENVPLRTVIRRFGDDPDGAGGARSAEARR